MSKAKKVKDIKDLTAVRWWWKADDKWIKYNDEVNLSLETDYQNGLKKIKVDDERFVDVSLTAKKIKDQMGSAEGAKDDELIGLQRRYDDEMKRRLVKRVAPKFFKGCTTTILVNDEDVRTIMERTITTYGGTVRPAVTKRTKLVVCVEEDLKDFEDDYKVAEDNEIPVVKQEYLVACMEEEDKVDEANYIAKLDSKKRKREDEEEEEKVKEDEEPPKKKQKTDTSSQKSNTNTTAASTNNTNQKSAAAKATPKAFKAGSEWMGVCSYAEGDMFPFILKVASVKGNKVEATIDWPTMNDAKTKVNGTIDGCQFEFTEYEVIQGEDEVEIPVTYLGELSDTSIEGQVKETESGMQATFKLDLVQNEDENGEEAAKEDEKMEEAEADVADQLQANKTYKGKSITEFPFEMKILKRKGVDVEGEITWTTMKCVTKFKGKVNGDKIEFEETEILKTENGGLEAVVPTSYSGQLSAANGSISGDFKSDDQNGTFKIEL
jgi:hypothetical protein